MLAQARLDFVSNMQYFDHEAAPDKAYLQDCYNGIYRLQNCGGLTLVLPRYFGFRKSLMHVLVNALNLEHFVVIGSDAVKEGWKYINKNMESLTKQFLECYMDYTSISGEEKEAILKCLIKKICNARFGAEVNARSTETTKWGGATYEGLSH
jgi:hypothetical protein